MILFYIFSELNWKQSFDNKHPMLFPSTVIPQSPSDEIMLRHCKWHINPIDGDNLTDKKAKEFFAASVN